MADKQDMGGDEAWTPVSAHSEAAPQECSSRSGDSDYCQTHRCYYTLHCPGRSEADREALRTRIAELEAENERLSQAQIEAEAALRIEETHREAAESRLAQARYYLRIFIHAHASGNSVPPHIEADARAALSAPPAPSPAPACCGKCKDGSRCACICHEGEAAPSRSQEPE